MREALRCEKQNSSHQNLVRVNENLELTRELNVTRKENARLAAEVTRLEARIQVRLSCMTRLSRDGCRPELGRSRVGGLPNPCYRTFTRNKATL